MEITKEVKNKKMIVKVSGQINTITAPELEKEVYGKLANIDTVVMDIKHVGYLSSAGIRVFSMIQKIIGGKDNFSVINVDKNVYKILDDVGLTDFMNIERYEQ